MGELHLGKSLNKKIFWERRSIWIFKLYPRYYIFRSKGHNGNSKFLHISNKNFLLLSSFPKSFKYGKEVKKIGSPET